MARPCGVPMAPRRGGIVFAMQTRYSTFCEAKCCNVKDWNNLED